MRVLIAGMNYDPEATGIAPYTTGLAEHLAGRGHDVVVSTTFPHYPQWRWQPGAAGRVERRNGVEVRRARVLLPRGPAAGWRVAYDSSLAGVTVANAFGLRPADLVLCVSPPIQVAFAGALLARRWRAPLLLLVKDLPLDAALAVGMLRPGAVHRTGRWLERRAYGLAQRIVVISRRFRASLAVQGVPDERVVEIPDWVDLDRVRPAPPDAAARARLGAAGGDFAVLHAGSMGAKQALGTAVRAAAQAGDPVRLALVGDGPERPALAALAGPGVRLLPLQPEPAFRGLLAAADALLLSQVADLRDAVAPSKLLTYMAAGRPVIAAVHPDSAAAHLVREAGCGVVVAPEDTAALAGAMRALSREPERGRRLGAAGRRFAEARFERGRVLARWEALLASLEIPSEERHRAWTGTDERRS